MSVSGKKSSKVGRSKATCERYRNEHRREKNKIRKLKKMIKNLSPQNRMRIKTEFQIQGLKNIIVGVDR